MIEIADRVIEDEGHCSESRCHDPKEKSPRKNKESNHIPKTSKMEEKVGLSGGKGKAVVAAEMRKFSRYS